MITLNIDRADARNVAELIELYLPQACKDFYDAGEFDNIDWLRSMIRSMDELKRVAKEVDE